MFIEAENGFEALDKLIKHKPDLILLNMFIGTVDKDTVDEIINLGVSDYLVKPFEIDALLEKVDCFLKDNM